MAWLQPWNEVPDNGRAVLEDELHRECGLRATAIGRRFDQDDVLFALSDAKVVEVHLTWRGGTEPDSRWPRMRHFPSLAAWVEARMMPDHQEWVAAESPFKLPSLEHGWFALGYTLDTHRHLLRLSANADVEERLLAWRETGTSWSDGLGTLIAAGTRSRIEMFAGAMRIDAVEFPLESLIPKFDRLPDGRWVVADTRCSYGDTNARILAPDGAPISRLCLGDGIAHLQCDRLGGIWVGYFDEGVFGNYGWGAGDGPEPIGAFGVSRFRPDGAVSWPLETTGFDLPVYDCYAMNIAHDGVWLCYYADFPIVHVPFDGELRQWRNDVIAGASLLAVDGELAVLLGGYEQEGGSGALLQLGDDGRTEVLHRFVLEPALLGALNAGRVCARGAEIHFVADDAWTILTVADIAAGLRRNPPLYPAFVPAPEEDGD